MTSYVCDEIISPTFHTDLVTTTIVHSQPPIITLSHHHVCQTSCQNVNSFNGSVGHILTCINRFSMKQQCSENRAFHFHQMSQSRSHNVKWPTYAIIGRLILTFFKILITSDFDNKTLFCSMRLLITNCNSHCVTKKCEVHQCVTNNCYCEIASKI